MDKPSPGPYVTKEGMPHFDDTTYVVTHPDFNDGFAIASCIGPDRDANARLLAASVDLLEACEAAKALLINDLKEPGRTVFWKLVDAIRKANGKTAYGMESMNERFPDEN